MDKYNSSQFIFGGDLNMCYSSGNSNQEIVSKLCSDNLLIWLHHDASTGSYTFHNDTASKYSLIDHFMSSVNLVPPNGLVSILMEDDNLSDHYAILSHFKITSTQTTASDLQPDCTKRLDWKVADICRYQLVLSTLLSRIQLPVDALLCQDTLCKSHSDSLECYYKKITDCLLSASRQSVPTVKTGVQKHWWTPELDSLKQECIDICNLWNQIGRPRSGVINTERLKRKFRYKIAVKEAASNADKAFNDKLLNQLSDKNHVEFWKSWRRRFCSNNIRPASCINGSRGDKDILQEFTNYFKLVGQPNSVDADLGYSEEVEKLLSDCTTLPSTQPLCVDLHDIQESISKLKPGKAVSFDGIYNEHIMYSCTHLLVHLCLLFNALLRHCIVPSDFCVGVIIPLLKNKQGDISSFEFRYV